MRTKSGSAFLRALAIQRRRVQQGFHSHLSGGERPEADSDPGHAADITEMAAFLEGPHGGGKEPPR